MQPATPDEGGPSQPETPQRTETAAEVIDTTPDEGGPSKSPFQRFRDYVRGRGPPGININGAAEAAKFLEEEPENTAHAEVVAEAFSAKERRKKRTGKKAEKAWEGVDWPAYVAEMDAQYQKEPKEEQLVTFMEKKDKLYRPFNYDKLRPAKKAKTA